MKKTELADVVTTIVGALLLVAFGLALLLGEIGGLGWKVHGLWLGVGAVLILPFRQTLELLKAARGALPFLDAEDEA